MQLFLARLVQDNGNHRRQARLRNLQKDERGLEEISNDMLKNGQRNKSL